MEIVEEEAEQYVRDLRAKLDKLTNKLRRKRNELEGLLTVGESLKVQMQTQQVECDRLGVNRVKLEAEIAVYDYEIIKKKHKKKGHQMIEDRTKHKRSLLVVNHRGTARKLQAATRKCATSARQMSTLKKQIQGIASEKELLYKAVEKKRIARADKMQRLNIKLARIDNVQRARDRREQKRLAVMERQQRKGLDALEKECTKGMLTRYVNAFKNQKSHLDRAFERIRTITGEEDINKIVELFSVRHMLCDQVSSKVNKLRAKLNKLQEANNKQEAENKANTPVEAHRRGANAYKEIDELDTQIRHAVNQREHLAEHSRTLMLLKDAIQLFAKQSCSRFGVAIKPTPDNIPEVFSKLAERIDALQFEDETEPQTESAPSQRATHNIRVKIGDSAANRVAAERGKSLLRDMEAEESYTLLRQASKKQADAMVKEHQRASRRRRKQMERKKQMSREKKQTKSRGKKKKVDSDAPFNLARPGTRGQPVKPEVK